MIIIGADFHPEFQEIASVNTDTGEYEEKRLTHPEEAEQFYRSLMYRKNKNSFLKGQGRFECNSMEKGG